MSLERYADFQISKKLSHKAVSMVLGGNAEPQVHTICTVLICVPSHHYLLLDLRQNPFLLSHIAAGL
jgi:hypothetical protein